MIKVTKPAMPPGFADPDSVFDRERAEALKFFKSKTNRNKSFPFKAYKNKLIVNSLNAHFGFKCAYCESSYAATAPVDIEHYRPKGEVVEDKKRLRPGYYWLAVDWINLLPSCRDCNSLRRHDFPGLGIQTRGKANAFPIQNPTSRATKPGQEKREKPLLLHPYRHDPRRHLRFSADGAIAPAVNKRGVASKLGETSIRVYGLDRPLLAKERRDRAIAILGSIAQARRLAQLVDQAGNAQARATAEQAFQAEVAALKKKIAANEEYSAMGRQFAEEFLLTLAG